MAERRAGTSQTMDEVLAKQDYFAFGLKLRRPATVIDDDAVRLCGARRRHKQIGAKVGYGCDKLFAVRAPFKLHTLARVRSPITVTRSLEASSV